MEYFVFRMARNVEAVWRIGCDPILWSLGAGIVVSMAADICGSRLVLSRKNGVDHGNAAMGGFLVSMAFGFYRAG